MSLSLKIIKHLCILKMKNWGQQTKGLFSQMCNQETALVEPLFPTEHDLKTFYTGPEGTPEATILRHIRTGYNYTASYL